MASNDTNAIAPQILASLATLMANQEKLAQRVDAFQEETRKEIKSIQDRGYLTVDYTARRNSVDMVERSLTPTFSPIDQVGESETDDRPPRSTTPSSASRKRRSPSSSGVYSSRIILTTYPGQVGIKPLGLNWGASDPKFRGPIVASRHPDSIRIRNSIGAHGGSYCIYHALSVAIGALPPTHRPDLVNTEPPLKLGPQPQWFDPEKIVSMDPFGHIVQQVYAEELKNNIDVRPSIAVTKAHMKIPEIEEAVKKGRLRVDGKVVINESGELNVVKAAVEPVWYLPGVAARFGVDETNLRRALFEDTGGMYPELITRPDLKVFLPPIGGFTIYIFGKVENVADSSKRLTLRVHDECNGSDVFGSDICTCRPYLMYGIEECVKEAQNGGSGVIIYFRKEGRALGEVTKYLVYNSRKRGGDLASAYFQRTENVAGVKDARFQALMPDALHWLGISKIDRMMSMSNMKYDAIVNAGITINERVPIPDDLIPQDSRVEIDAKIAAGYFTTGKVPTTQDLDAVKGRNWEWDEIQH